MPTQPTTSINEPFFDGGDWITLLVGLIAAGIAIASWRAALRAAKANEDMVKEQRLANRMAAQQMTDERMRRSLDDAREQAAAEQAAALRETAAREAAGRVVVELSPNGGIDVAIRNESGTLFRDLRLLEVVPLDKPHLTWRRNPAVFGGPKERASQLEPDAEHVVPVVFFDEENTMHRMPGAPYAAVVRFTDEGGRRWEIGRGEPRQVAADDSDVDAQAGD